MMRNIIFRTLYGLGAVFLLGPTAYHILVHPEWTQAEALRILWPAYLLGGVSIGVGCLVEHYPRK